MTGSRLDYEGLIDGLVADSRADRRARARDRRADGHSSGAAPAWPRRRSGSRSRSRRPRSRALLAFARAMTDPLAILPDQELRRGQAAAARRAQRRRPARARRGDVLRRAGGASPRCRARADHRGQRRPRRPADRRRLRRDRRRGRRARPQRGGHPRDRKPRSRTGSSASLLVPGDCPLLDPTELEQLLVHPAGERSALIVPDRHGTGTNALLLAPPDVLAPSFGPDSRPRHLADAAAAGVPAEVVELESLGTRRRHHRRPRGAPATPRGHPRRRRSHSRHAQPAHAGAILSGQAPWHEPSPRSQSRACPRSHPGDDLAELIATRSRAPAPKRIEPEDVLVIAHKIVSKAEGRIRRLIDVAAGSEARSSSATRSGRTRVTCRSSSTSHRPVRRASHGVLICVTHHGFVCANAGVDASNVPGEETLVLLPHDPDASARKLRNRLNSRLGTKPAVVITDSFGRAWRHGQVDVAIGCAGLEPLEDWRGRTDATGRELTPTRIAVADELAAAADLAADQGRRATVSPRPRRRPARQRRGRPRRGGDDPAGVGGPVPVDVAARPAAPRSPQQRGRPPPRPAAVRSATRRGSARRAPRSRPAGRPAISDVIAAGSRGSEVVISSQPITCEVSASTISQPTPGHPGVKSASPTISPITMATNSRRRRSRRTAARPRGAGPPRRAGAAAGNPRKRRRREPERRAATRVPAVGAVLRARPRSAARRSARSGAPRARAAPAARTSSAHATSGTSTTWMLASTVARPAPTSSIEWCQRIRSAAKKTPAATAIRRSAHDRLPNRRSSSHASTPSIGSANAQRKIAAVDGEAWLSLTRMLENAIATAPSNAGHPDQPASSPATAPAQPQARRRVGCRTSFQNVQD